MTGISVKQYVEGEEVRWNQFVSGSNNGTIFHCLDFLSYHGDRFKNNAHHLVWYKGESILAVMPMGIFEEEGKLVAKSPYGASWGGIVQPIKFKFERSAQVVDALLEYLRQRDIREVVLTLPPRCYYRQYSVYVEFQLMRAGFYIANREVTSVLPIFQGDSAEIYFEVRGRNSARKAEKSGVTVKQNDDLDVFYPILLGSKRKHEAVPTHTLDELIDLKRRFPGGIVADVAYIDADRPIAGALYFICNPLCILTFYLAHETEFSELNATNLLVRERILQAQRDRFKFFDFGTSTHGMEPRPNIFKFKESFGSVGYFRDTYRLVL